LKNQGKPRVDATILVLVLSVGLLISQAAASKDSDRYSKRQAFLISDENWEEILQLVPLAIWTTTKEGDDRQWCNTLDEGICAYPVLIYHGESPEGDFHLQRISRKNIFMHGYESKGLRVLEDSLVFHPDKIKDGGLTRVEVKLLNNGTRSVNPGSIELWNWPLKDYLKPAGNVSESGKIKIDVNSDIQPGEILSLPLEFRLNLTRGGFGADSGFDADSTIHFLREFRPDRLTIVGEIPSWLRVRLEEVLSGTPIEEITAENYSGFWNWDNVARAVYSEDDYSAALVASVYASLIDAPYIIGDHYGKELLKGKDVTCIGNVTTIECNETYSINQLRRIYAKLTKTEKIILTNPGDIEMGISEEFITGNSGNIITGNSGRIFSLYSGTSLSAPFLAAGKHELILETYSDSIEETDKFIEDEIKGLDIKAEYLTIMASPLAIPMVNLYEGRYAVDQWEYSNIDTDPYLELATGRIFGITPADVSSYVNRALFYNQMPNDADKMLFVGKDFLRNENEVYGYSRIFNSIGYETDSYRGIARPENWNNKGINWNNKGFIFYGGHGSTYSAGIPYWQIPKLRNTFEIDESCHACDFTDALKNNDAGRLYCTNFLRNGGIGIVGAVDESGYLNSWDFITGIYAEGFTVGEAMRHIKNVGVAEEVRYLYGEKDEMQLNDGSWYALLGDPTIKLNVTYKLPRSEILPAGGEEGYTYSIDMESIRIPYPPEFNFVFTTIPERNSVISERIHDSHTFHIDNNLYISLGPIPNNTEISHAVLETGDAKEVNVIPVYDFHGDSRNVWLELRGMNLSEVSNNEFGSIPLRIRLLKKNATE